MMLSSKFASSLSTSNAHTTDFNSSVLKSFGRGHSVLQQPGDTVSKQRVRLEVSQADDTSGDEVPLNSIRVQRDVTWQETIYDARRQGI